MTIGWKLAPEERSALLLRFPPRWPVVLADHVTLASQVDAKRPLPMPAAAEIVGHVDDGAGVEAFVVRIGGITDRPDGSTYHITWSIDRNAGRKAVESNDVIARLGWTDLPEPIAVNLFPAVLRRCTLSAASS